MQPSKIEAVLCFIVQSPRILLIHKKRGLGAGKINGPGGRIELNETPEEAAIRESIEEIGVKPINLEKKALLDFEFTNGLWIHCHAFVAKEYEGELQETDEAAPFWCNINEIPFCQMWQDDVYWLPYALEGREMRGYFLFDEEKMLKCSFSLEEF